MELWKTKALTLILSCLVSVGSSTWKFDSTYEASIDGHPNFEALCMGNCMSMPGYDHKRCVYDWRQHEAECTESSIRTKKYRTLDNKICKSNCGFFGGEIYMWCATEDNKWDYCSRMIALRATLRHETHNKYVTCTDACEERGTTYHWCNTVIGWQYCYPHRQVLVPDYRTKNIPIRCKSPCKLYKSEKKSYCYDEKGSWARCYLNPQYEQVLNEIHLGLARCRRGGFFKDGYRLCRITNKRYSNGQLHFNDCNLDVEALAQQHESNNPSHLVRNVATHHVITENPDPILSYTVLPRIGYFDRDVENDFDLPVVVRALVTTHTLLPVAARRQQFRNHVSPNYAPMNPVRDDERGHIITSRLGGAMEMFNIFRQPQNRGRASTWSEMETQLDQFLRGHSNRYAEFTAILSYSTDVNGSLVRRPTAIAVRIRLYIDSILTDLRGNRLNSFEENKMENMYFSNDPNATCN